ncbi:MAG: hypothetical protein JWO54_48 [Candidatus Saccharibacteria bacterium]|jgi:hypothetical protein|nr:hypothetical protein [Candidatus Saccharibacteria bacterium]MDB5180290.1 hypothetical protein [Candidatus Saccharibacteria bacterium]
MQPETPQSVPMGSEQLPKPPAYTGEGIPSLPPLDTGIEKGGERHEQAAEAGAHAADATTLAAPVAVPVAPPVVVPQNDPVQPVASSSPLVAADEDLIEKEWVDKAKEIILHTKDDPHARTQKVNELQRDYLQKRYGRVVGASE